MRAEHIIVRACPDHPDRVHIQFVHATEDLPLCWHVEAAKTLREGLNSYFGQNVQESSSDDLRGSGFPGDEAPL